MTDDQITTLRAYAAGQLGTHRTIERLDMRDYADLVIALSQNDLNLPKPADTIAHQTHLARAREVLQPRLRHDN